MKKTILIWIIVILGATNIATVAVILSQSKKPVYDVPAKVPDTHLGRFFRDELNLSQKQHFAFREFRRQFHQEAMKITSEMKSKRTMMLLELKKNNPDSTRLNDLANELGDLHAELKRTTFEFYLKMKKEVNEEQQEKLFIIFYNLNKKEGNLNMPDTIRNN